jgi:4-amino-4-deoxy-L-arabinose transferase-like glycosyltransferase
MIAEKYNLKRPEIVFLVILFALALITRIDYNTWHGVQLSPDSYEYLRVADDLLMEGWTMDSRRTPGYPLWIVLHYGLFGYKNLAAIAMVQTIISIMSIFLLYFFARELTGNRIIAGISALATAVNVNIIHHESMILTETITIFLTIISMWIFLKWVKKDYPLLLIILFNLLLTVILFIRPIFVALIVLVPVLALAVYLRTKNGKAALRLFVSYIFIMLLPVVSWCLAMKSVYGFVGITNVAHINMLSVVIQDDLQQYAPEKYSQFVSDLI